MSTSKLRYILNEFGVNSDHFKQITSFGQNTHWIVDTLNYRVVLRQYSSDHTIPEIMYELALLSYLENKGWPVPIALAPPVKQFGSIWVIFRFMPGRKRTPRTEKGSRLEQRQRGRLLAELHQDTAGFMQAKQRTGWLGAERGMRVRTGKAPIDQLLRRFESQFPEHGFVLRTNHDRTWMLLEELLPHAPQPIVIHNDFTPWNILYSGERLSGILDFDHCHVDIRVADFALSWRGRFDDVIYGYEEESKLEPIEWALIAPIYKAVLISSAVAEIDRGTMNTEWAVSHLKRYGDHPGF